jgi:hypothetical protein
MLDRSVAASGHQHADAAKFSPSQEDDDAARTSPARLQLRQVRLVGQLRLAELVAHVHDPPLRLLGVVNCPAVYPGARRSCWPRSPPPPTSTRPARPAACRSGRRRASSGSAGGRTRGRWLAGGGLLPGHRPDVLPPVGLGGRSGQTSTPDRRYAAEAENWAFSAVTSLCASREHPSPDALSLHALDSTPASKNPCVASALQRLAS